MVKTFTNIVNASGGSGGGGGGATPVLTFKDAADTGDGFFAQSLNTTSLEVTLDEAGSYILGLIGSADRLMTIENAEVTNGAGFDLPYALLASDENTAYESINFIRFTLNSANKTVRVTFKGGTSNGHDIYRAAIAAWHYANYSEAHDIAFTEIEGDNSSVITVAENDALIVMVHGRGSMGTSFVTGVADENVALKLYETGSDFYYGVYSESGLSAGTITPDNNPAGNVSRAYMGAFKLVAPT